MLPIERNLSIRCDFACQAKPYSITNGQTLDFASSRSGDATPSQYQSQVGALVENSQLKSCGLNLVFSANHQASSNVIVLNCWTRWFDRHSVTPETSHQDAGGCPDEELFAPSDSDSSERMRVSRPAVTW